MQIGFWARRRLAARQPSNGPVLVSDTRSNPSCHRRNWGEGLRRNANLISLFEVGSLLLLQCSRIMVIQAAVLGVSRLQRGVRLAVAGSNRVKRLFKRTSPDGASWPAPEDQKRNRKWRK